MPTHVMIAKGNGAHGGCSLKTSTCFKKNSSTRALNALARVTGSKRFSSFISTVFRCPGKAGPNIHGIANVLEETQRMYLFDEIRSLILAVFGPIRISASLQIQQHFLANRLMIH